MRVKPPVLHKLNGILITLMFSIAIFVPFFISIFEKDKDISEVEKRTLSTFPEIGGSIDDIKKFPKLFDTYYSDRFGLRDRFTWYYKKIKFGLGDSPSEDVTIGKDGWLFLGSIKDEYDKNEDPIGDFRNVNLFSENELKKFARHMASLHSWLNDKGIEYIFIIAPNKHTVYFDKLPDYISKANDYSAADQLIEYLESHTSVPVVDLRKILMENKQKHQLYYKTDTHWNHFAANIAQYEIMLEIEKRFPGKIEPEIMKLQEGSIEGGGDLAGLIGVHDFSDLNPYPVFENSCNLVKYPEDAEGREPHSYSCEGQKLNAVIYRDSFFTVLQPYFCRKFKRSAYIWEKLEYDSLKKYINSEHPDIVIEEWVERSLPLVPDIIPELLNQKFYKKVFKYSDTSIFNNDFNLLTYNSHIKIVDNSHKFIRMKSVGIDPIINFPPLPFKEGLQYIVHLEINSSVNSVLKLFYSDSEVAGYPFSEEKSVRVDVNPGENDVYILLDYDKLGKQLRLDPVSGAGEVEIKTIEIREIKSLLTGTYAWKK